METVASKIRNGVVGERGEGLPKISLADMDPVFRAMPIEASDASQWFGPLQPLAPAAPADVAGRQLDFPQGANIGGLRQGEHISFHDLRNMADAYDLMRLVIETRKDQIERMQWVVQPRAGRAGPGAERLRQLNDFFASPNRDDDFGTWLRMLLEDLLVIDAATIWCERDRAGRLIGLHPLDGATIKRIVDPWGRTPGQDAQGRWGVAYQQILKGLPAVDYTARDLIYAPRNRRVHRIYGFSPVEQVMMTVNIALRRQLFQLNYFTEGNIPESLIGVPDSWTPDQIKSYQDYWDNYFTGDAAARRHAKFVPGGVAKTFIQIKEPELKSDFDDWLTKIVCFAFSVSPQSMISQVNRSTAETQKQIAEEEGLRPLLNWAKRLFDRILQREFAQSDVEFVWTGGMQIDENAQQLALCGYVAAGVMTRNEARLRIGLCALADPLADQVTAPN